MVEYRRELPRLVIFDLDGTLVDTVPDITVALNAALADLDLAAVSESEVRIWVGNGARRLCGRATSRGVDDHAQPALVARLLDRFLVRYAEHICVSTRVYPGVRDLLIWLSTADVALACVTNKPFALTERLLTILDLRKHFRHVLGGDSLPRSKPDPLPLLECARHFAVSPQECLMIGDSENDIAAANAAGIDSVCVSYGYNQGRDVNRLGANLVLATLADLPQHLVTTK